MYLLLAQKKEYLSLYFFVNTAGYVNVISAPVFINSFLFAVHLQGILISSCSPVSSAVSVSSADTASPSAVASGASVSSAASSDSAVSVSSAGSSDVSVTSASSEDSA